MVYFCVQGKGKGKGKGKASKSAEVEKPADEVYSDSKNAEIVKLKALDVFAGCGGTALALCAYSMS